MFIFQKNNCNIQILEGIIQKEIYGYIYIHFSQIEIQTIKIK